MEEQELITLMNDFINENGLWNEFIEVAELKGYTEQEIDNLIKEN